MIPGSVVEREHHPPDAAGMGAVPADPLGSARASDPVSGPGKVVPVAVGAGGCWDWTALASGESAVFIGARYERMSVHFVNGCERPSEFAECGRAAASAACLRRWFFLLL